MLDSKLISMFRTLNKRELQRFEEYIKSPFFNKNEKVLHLFDIIKEEYPSCNSPRLNKTIVFNRLFPQKKQHDSSLRAVMSLLTKLLEDFFAYLEYEKSANFRERLKLDAFVNRRLDRVFDKFYNSIQKQLRKGKQNVDYFYHVFRLVDIVLRFNIGKGDRKHESGLQQVMNNFDIYYVAAKLKYTCATINRQNVFDKQYDLHLLDEVLQLVKHPILKDIPLIQIYYNICLLWLKEDKSEMYYQKIRQLIGEHMNVIDAIEIRSVYVNLTNYCTQKVKLGHSNYLRELFELYKEMLATKAMWMDDENKHMSPHHYKNFVTVGLRLQEYEWTEQFITQYKKELDPNHQKSVYNFALALLSFELKEYNKAKSHLLEVNFLDDYYQISYKVLLIKCYYELEESSVLQSSIEAFRIYLIRQKSISQVNRAAYQSYVNLMKKLLRIKAGGTKKLTNLQTEVLKEKQIAERQWLLQKIEELLMLQKK